MTVDATRTINNDLDVGRKIPASALSTQVLLELEGAVIEKVVGPDDTAAGDPADRVELSRPAVSVIAILSYVTATGATSAVALAPIEGTHWDLTPTGPNGVGVLVNPHATADFSAETWIVIYKADAPDETQGGQSSVTP